MQAFPLFLKLTDRPVLLVGGSDAAAAKLRLLLSAGARCTVVAPELSADMASLSSDRRVTLRQRAFEAADIDGHQLVFSAHDSEDADHEVVVAAKTRNVLVNVVDRPALTDFIMPAVVNRGEVVVAISTHGAAPVLARKVRAVIESVLPERIGKLAAFAGRFRAAVRSRLSDGVARRRFWEDFFEGPIAAAVLAGDERRAAREVIAAINGRQKQYRGESHVIRVPADAEQLTLRELRLLRQADIVLHDGMVATEIMDFTRRDSRQLRVDAKNVEQVRAAEIAAGHRVVILVHADHASLQDRRNLALLRSAGE